MEYYLAIDIGASSGRHIVGWQEDGTIHTREVYRFPNGPVRLGGHLCWDPEQLETQVKKGISIALEAFGTLKSLAIDTWGVDYVLLHDGGVLSPCYAYRDDRTRAAVEMVHQIVPFDTLYQWTGIQYQAFNTIYQLYADQLSGRLDNADTFLMLPEYLSYRLTGNMVHEYTNATTTGLVDPDTKTYHSQLIRQLGLPERLFGPLRQPGTVVGQYLGIPVLLCASHDTASAVEGIPMEQDGLFLSSGTWSLLGAKLPSPIRTPSGQQANFTNEGGVGYVRFLKNIMGLWLLQQLQKEIGDDFGAMAQMARDSGEHRIFDVNHPRFTAPESMKAAVLEALGEASLSNAAIYGAVHHSLAACYGEAIAQLEEITGRSWDRLYIVGGGAKNGYLNELTEQYTGKQVIALPIEATALGNLKIQMEATK